MTTPFEPIEHTADTGLKIFGSTPEEFFTNAAYGFYSLVTDFEKIREHGTKKVLPTYRAASHLTIRLRVEGIDDLFFAWLRELLFEFSAKKMIYTKFNFRHLDDTSLTVDCSGEKFNPEIHDQKLEVKAVTYHGFYVKKTGPMWEARVIFDI